MKPVPNPHTRGFSLVELLVVIAIVAVLAAVATTIANRTLRTARSTKDSANLRQCGVFLGIRTNDLGHYPVGLHLVSGESWVDEIVEQQVGGDSSITQLETFWSPLLERDIPLTLDQVAVTHFGANPYIMTEPAAGGNPGEDQPMWIVRPSQLSRPSQQILLCGMPPQSAAVPYDMAHPIAWGVRELAGGGTPTAGSIPPSDPADADMPLGLSTDLGRTRQYNDLPDFFRHGNGKGTFLFADGHMETIEPTGLKQKHWAVSY
jgi:prepilin-type N-terminal cleavage/methylation domain-containing protein/prepilin-type processing-associated H-X9-DG protein